MTLVWSFVCAHLFNDYVYAARRLYVCGEDEAATRKPKNNQGKACEDRTTLILTGLIGSLPAGIGSTCDYFLVIYGLIYGVRSQSSQVSPSLSFYPFHYSASNSYFPLSIWSTFIKAQRQQDCQKLIQGRIISWKYNFQLRGINGTSVKTPGCRLPAEDKENSQTDKTNMQRLVFQRQSCCFVSELYS